MGYVTDQGFHLRSTHGEPDMMPNFLAQNLGPLHSRLCTLPTTLLNRLLCRIRSVYD